MHKHAVESRRSTLTRGLVIGGLSAGVVAALTIGLVACAPTAQPQPAPVPDNSTPAVPSTPAAPTLNGNPVPFTCDEALPASFLATLPQAWTEDASFSPATGSSAEQAVAMGGFACGFTSNSGQSLVVAVANPDAASQTTLKAEFASSSQPSTDFNNDTAFFSNGDAEVFAGTYWISAVSPAFAQASDASSLVGMIIQTIPAG